MEIDNRRNYIYIVKNSSAEGLKAADKELFLKESYGSTEYLNLPLTSSISIENYEDDIFTSQLELNTKRLKIHALRNTLDRQSIRSYHYKTSSSYGDKTTQKLTLISIPSIFYGSSIKKGSIDLSINYNNQKIARAQDIKLNGEIIETEGLNTGSIAGVVLYEQGFILLTGSWDQNVLDPTETFEVSSSWNNFGTGSSFMMTSGTFDVNFSGINEINTITMLTHADKGELNYSNNPTYIKFGQTNTANTFVDGYYENDKLEIKNITKYPYENYSGSLEKQTYISKIGIYDEKKNLIGVAKLAKPVRKTETRDFTFKLKLDI